MVTKKKQPAADLEKTALPELKALVASVFGPEASVSPDAIDEAINIDQLYDRLFSIAESDETLSNANGIMDILEMMINHQLKHPVGAASREDKHHHQMMAKILSAMVSNVGAMQKEVEDRFISSTLDDETASMQGKLVNFYKRINNSRPIKSQREASAHNLLGSLQSMVVGNELNKVYKDIAKLEKEYGKFTERFASILKQGALVELFGRYLANDLPRNPLAMRSGPPSVRRQGKEIFPNTWPPYTGDPEAAVDIAMTIQNIAGDERPSLFKSFSAEQLTKDFKHAFPWAITPEQLAKIDPDEVPPGFNLLGTATPIDPKLQIRVMQFLLLSMDLIGKAVGIQGNRILEAYDFVDRVTTSLEAIAEVLDIEKINVSDLKGDLEPRLEQAIALENRIQLDKNPRNKAFSNPPVNAYCRVNELQSCQLLRLGDVKPVVPHEVVSEASLNRPKQVK